MKHIVSFSGGKDSTALYLLAMERGIDFRAVFADTDNENPLTIEFVKNIHIQTGGPKVEFYKADFTDKFETRRKNLQENWSKERKKRGQDWYYQPLPQKIIDEALAVLHPTGNVFLDMCLLHGRMPSTRARFCSEQLKRDVIYEQVLMPLLDAGETIVSWQGVRADESINRANLDIVEEVSEEMILYRPIITWNVEQVFAMHDKYNVDANPLYKLGMGRVGCMPCIHARKKEIQAINTRFPEELERIAEWEKVVAKVNRWCATNDVDVSCFFGPETIPKVKIGPIHKVIQWSKTTRGANNIDLFSEEVEACSSIYGLCE